ncbi:MAG TPA: 6-phosphogluconolactonase [Balneolaceae bacterium]|nr:6-phosphogluconolactonase [Balneolaceae bacterium]|tara:strand:- start:47456 stop:48625 length:1170 start_codon:yes stop_codon:yes gene_type:complete
MRSVSIFMLALIVMLTGCNTKESQKNMHTSTVEKAFIGNYTRDEGWVNGKAEGIYRISLGSNGTELSLDETAAPLINPSFLAISPDKNHLYAVSELARPDEETGFVVAFHINDDLSLEYIGKYPSNGQAPAHVSVHPTGDMVFAANYLGGVAMVYKRNEDGSLEATQQIDVEGSGPHQNQDASHTHMVKVSPDGKYLFIPDLGSDKIWTFAVDTESATVSPTDQEFASVAPGSGPRHMDFHPTLNIAYVINELNSTLSVFDYDPASSSLQEKQVVNTLPEDFTEWNSTADIHVHPNGKYVYSSNRGHNSLAAFSVDASTGMLTFLNHTSTEGEIPRNFAINPNGEIVYVANQNSDNITVFDLDTETGKLTFTKKELEIPTPVCIVFYEE